MIELSGLGSNVIETNSFGGSGIESGFGGLDQSIEFSSFNLEGGIEGSIEQGQSAQSSLPNAAVDYIVSSKNSLVGKSLDIHESYLGDDNFSFKDKMQLLEKTYTYQLEMTYYNTFMSQTMQKVDSLIQLK